MRGTCEHLRCISDNADSHARTGTASFHRARLLQTIIPLILRPYSFIHIYRRLSGALIIGLSPYFNCDLTACTTPAATSRPAFDSYCISLHDSVHALVCCLHGPQEFHPLSV